MKISLFVHDLASNPIIRAAPIAQALQLLGYDIEILGFLIKGTEVYRPYRYHFTYKTIPSTGTMSDVLQRTEKLSLMATGDIIYAFKPLWTSFWPALKASGFGKKKPLLLDVEDDELLGHYGLSPQLLYRGGIRNWHHPNAFKYLAALHLFVRLCHNTTVASTKLQRRYGGSIILHGPDENVFNPETLNEPQYIYRQNFNLPKNSPLILFAGVPHPHKGIQVLVEALNRPAAQDYKLILAGDETFSEFISAASNLKDRCQLLGFVDNNKLPELLSAIDIIATPQLKNNFTQAQIPAKLLEAMAMGKAIIVSRVSDLAQIIGEETEHPRGWVIEPGDANQLATVLHQIQSNPAEAQHRGRNARQFFLENASIKAISQRLEPILSNLCLSG